MPVHERSLPGGTRRVSLFNPLQHDVTMLQNLGYFFEINSVNTNSNKMQTLLLSGSGLVELDDLKTTTFEPWSHLHVIHALKMSSAACSTGIVSQPRLTTGRLGHLLINSCQQHTLDKAVNLSFILPTCKSPRLGNITAFKFTLPRPHAPTILIALGIRFAFLILRKLRCLCPCTRGRGITEDTAQVTGDPTEDG